MVNEELNDENKVIEEDEEKKNEKVISMQTPNKQCSLKILALPMPTEAIKIIEENKDLLKAYRFLNLNSPQQKNTQTRWVWKGS